MTLPVRCDEHGERHYCYVQPDGSHVHADRCLCGWRHRADCPVIEHARRGAEQDAALIRTLQRRRTWDRRYQA